MITMAFKIVSTAVGARVGQGIEVVPLVPVLLGGGV